MSCNKTRAGRSVLDPRGRETSSVQKINGLPASLFADLKYIYSNLSVCVLWRNEAFLIVMGLSCF